MIVAMARDETNNLCETCKCNIKSCECDNIKYGAGNKNYNIIRCGSYKSKNGLAVEGVYFEDVKEL